MSNAKMSRRGFVAGAGAALASAGLAGVAFADEAPEQVWDQECEVLVCGYGAAGAACAIEAADNGAQVLIIEKAALPGGSMARCGGAIMGAGTKVQEALDVTDSADALFDWVNTCVNQNYNLCPEEIIRAYADMSGEDVDWICNLCETYCGHELFEVEWATENEGAQDNEATGDNGNGVPSG